MEIEQPKKEGLNEIEKLKIKLINNIYGINDINSIQILYYSTQEHLKRQKEKATD